MSRNVISITEFFTALDAPLRNRMWSWGALTDSTNAVVFRVWDDESEIINGKRRISIEEAVMLAALFETDSDFWINVQASHDRWEAQQLMVEKSSVQPIRALLAG